MRSQRPSTQVMVNEAILAIVLLLMGGTVIFQYLENWSWVDSFYFTGATLLTIGYGDLVPSHDLSKVLVVIFGFLAVGTFIYAVSIIGGAVHQKIPEIAETISDATNGIKKGK